MSYTDALNYSQAALCLGIAYNCFERSAKTDKKTLSAISLSFVALGLSSVLMAVWPWWDHMRVVLGCPGVALVTPASLLFQASILAVQTACRVYWVRGVPRRYQRRELDRVAAVQHIRRYTDSKVSQF